MLVIELIKKRVDRNLLYNSGNFVISRLILSQATPNLTKTVSIIPTWCSINHTRKLSKIKCFLAQLYVDIMNKRHNPAIETSQEKEDILMVFFNTNVFAVALYIAHNISPATIIPRRTSFYR